jgi:hypothetical protein
MLDLFETPNSWCEQAQHTECSGQNIFLTDLADELLVSIAEFINLYIEAPSAEREPQNFSGSLLNFALVSKRLCRICEPVLYSNVQQSASKPLFPVLRTILTRPDLAHHVRVFQSSAIEIRQIPAHPGISMSFRANDSWKPLVVAAVHSVKLKNNEYFPTDHELHLGETEATRWVKDVERGSWNATVALTIAYLPSIEIIRLAEWSNKLEERCSYIVKMMKRARILQTQRIRIPMALFNLRTVSLCFRKWEVKGFDLEQLFPFLELPSLRSLTAQKLFEDSFLSVQHKSWVVLSNITSLCLLDAWIQPHILESFLRYIPSIQTFNYQHGNTRHPVDDDRGQTFEDYRSMSSFEPPRMLPVLQSFKSSLRELTVRNEIDDSMLSLLSSLPIGRLLDFPKLRYMKMSAALLRGGTRRLARNEYQRFPKLPECVPSSLEHLCICDIRDYEVIESLIDLLNEKENIVPNLIRVELCWSKKKVDHPLFDMSNSSSGKVSTPESLCINFGIEFFECVGESS